MQKNISTDTELRRLSYADLSTFCEQIALILGSGITAVEGFYILREETQDKSTIALFDAILDNLEVGETLSSTLEKVGVFPNYMVQMVRIGEVSGRLETVFRSLVTYYNREDSLRKSIKHSVTYPLGMVVMMLLVIGVLVVRVMPIFNSVFQQLGSEITGFSKVLLDIGMSISNNAIVYITILVMLAALIIIGVFTGKGREIIKNVREKFVLTRGLVYNIAVSRFSNGMSLMLSSGLDTDESLKIVEELVENETLKGKIQNIRAEVEAGTPFATSMADNKIFSGVYARMLAVGFKTGSMDGVMQSISERYDEDVTKRLENIVAVIEPTVVAVLCVIIGAILLSVMLPLMSIISHMG